MLAEVEERLHTIGAGITALLAPGISEDRVRSRLAELGMDPPVSWSRGSAGTTA